MLALDPNFLKDATPLFLCPTWFRSLATSCSESLSEKIQIVFSYNWFWLSAQSQPECLKFFCRGCAFEKVCFLHFPSAIELERCTFLLTLPLQLLVILPVLITNFWFSAWHFRWEVSFVRKWELDLFSPPIMDFSSVVRSRSNFFIVSATCHCKPTSFPWSLDI